MPAMETPWLVALMMAASSMRRAARSSATSLSICRKGMERGKEIKEAGSEWQRSWEVNSAAARVRADGAGIVVDAGVPTTTLTSAGCSHTLPPPGTM